MPIVTAPVNDWVELTTGNVASGSGITFQNRSKQHAVRIMGSTSATKPASLALGLDYFPNQGELKDIPTESLFGTGMVRVFAQSLGSESVDIWVVE